MRIKNEFPLLIVVMIPFIYIAYIWNSVAEKVPIHWNGKGEIDRWGTKEELLIIPLALPLLTYLIFLFVPILDPKKKIEKMGNKFYQLKFIIVSLMSILAMYIIYVAKNLSILNPNGIFIIVGLLFTIMGNYFQSIPANYFIGIKTPWTLENENVWKKTHILGGKLWFAGGLLIIISSFLISKKINLIILLIITGIITLIPVIYSYIAFKNEEKPK